MNPIAKHFRCDLWSRIQVQEELILHSEVLAGTIGHGQVVDIPLGARIVRVADTCDALRIMCNAISEFPAPIHEERREIPQIGGVSGPGL